MDAPPFARSLRIGGASTKIVILSEAKDLRFLFPTATEKQKVNT
jgi:hypothetical protein